MAGNSQRRGRRLAPKAGAPKGTGGKNKDSLAGRGRTLPADERPWHKAYSGTEKLPQRTAWKQEKERRAAAEEGRAPKIGQPGTKDTTWGKGGGRGTPTTKGRGGKPAGRGGPRVAPGRKANPAKDSPELLVGRNPVLESLRTQVPATALYTAQGIDVDDRVKEIVRTAADRGIAILEVSRAELDRMTGGVLHQGVGLQVPPFAYEPFDDLVAAALEQAAPLLVALDGVTDPRNLGAVIRSAAAVGAQGVFVPERRAAGLPAPAGRHAEILPKSDLPSWAPDTFDDHPPSHGGGRLARHPGPPADGRRAGRRSRPGPARPGLGQGLRHRRLEAHPVPHDGDRAGRRDQRQRR